MFIHLLPPKREMTKEEIYERANSVVGIGGMTGNERLCASGLIDLFDKAKKHDKYLARAILQALKFDELSISQIVGYSTDSLKYPNAWDFPNENSNGLNIDNKATLEYSNLNEIGMGAPLGGYCCLTDNKGQKTALNEWLGGPAIWSTDGMKVAIPTWIRNFLKKPLQQITILDIVNREIIRYKRTFNVLDIRTFDKNEIYGYDSPIYRRKTVKFDLNKERILERRKI